MPRLPGRALLLSYGNRSRSGVSETVGEPLPGARKARSTGGGYVFSRPDTDRNLCRYAVRRLNRRDRCVARAPDLRSHEDHAVDRFRTVFRVRSQRSHATARRVDGPDYKRPVLHRGGDTAEPAYRFKPAAAHSTTDAAPGIEASRDCGLRRLSVRAILSSFESRPAWLPPAERASSSEASSAGKRGSRAKSFTSTGSSNQREAARSIWVDSIHARGLGTSRHAPPMPS